ncbi:MAG: helix-turn-helix transcriptional regulator [Verrucomicrobiota bacterium]
MEISTAFALVLKKHRSASGISQELLAEKADIHPTHVGLIERSLRNPSLKVAKAIADALGLSLAQMIAEAEQLQQKRS